MAMVETIQATAQSSSSRQLLVAIACVVGFGKSAAGGWSVAASLSSSDDAASTSVDGVPTSSAVFVDYPSPPSGSPWPVFSATFGTVKSSEAAIEITYDTEIRSVDRGAGGRPPRAIRDRRRSGSKSGGREQLVGDVG
jgi:hypothetical protein